MPVVYGVPAVGVTLDPARSSPSVRTADIRRRSSRRLVLNQEVAKALGITFPPEMVQAASQ